MREEVVGKSEYINFSISLLSFDLLSLFARI